MKPIILDADLNHPSDDFEALLLLAASNAVELVGCCAVAGNTWMEEVWVNIRGALDLIGVSNTPVGQGSSWQALQGNRDWALKCRELGTFPFIGAYEKSLEPRTRSSESNNPVEHELGTAPSASELLKQAGAMHGDRLELLVTGPLTNLALALTEVPSLVNTLGQVTVMGGHFGPTAETGRSDFNVWFDPGSAAAVFGSELRIRLVPLDVCRAARCTPTLLSSISALGGGWADYFRQDFRGMMAQHGVGMPLYDQLAALICIDDSLVLDSDFGRVEVDGSFDRSRGRTRFTRDTKGPIELVTAVDCARAHEALIGLVSSMSERPAFPENGTWRQRIL